MGSHFFLLCLCFFSVIFKPSIANKTVYIVHMDLSSMPKAFSNHKTWFSAVLDSISDSTPLSSSNIIYSYTNAINGFSALLSSSELEELKHHPSCLSVIKDKSLKYDTTHTFQFLGLNVNYGAWPISNYGNDVIIGVVDSGVWPESKSYHDHGLTPVPARWNGKCETGTAFNSSMCNRKLIGARYFNKGLLAHNPNLTISMNSARDTDGHGTHTSSTAAGSQTGNASFLGYAQGNARGMAPMARVAVYKCFWPEGFYHSDALAAIDQAIADGVDVLSMSFGIDDVPLYDDPVAVATFSAMEKGIFVSTSSGNEGPDLKTLHNGIPWVLNVAAGTVDRRFQGTIRLHKGTSVAGISFYTGKNPPSGEYPIILIEICENKNDLKSVGKKIVVCVNKKTTFPYEQISNVQNSTAIGGIFITNQPTYFPISFPTLLLTPQQGEMVLAYIKSSIQPTASLMFYETVLGPTTIAPRLAAYSSRGPSSSCPSVLKPDIFAPGDYILASWPPNVPVPLPDSRVFSNFFLASGTSMSCPHASGVAALIRSVYPDWSPAAVRSALMTTADVLDNSQSPIKDTGFNNKEATPLAMGAGQINPNRALNPGLVYEANSQDYVNLLCGLNFTSAQIRTITRASSYNCSNPSHDLNYPSFISFVQASCSNSNDMVVQFKRTVTNVGEDNSVYVAEIISLKGFRVGISPNILEFAEKYEQRSYNLTITGPRCMEANTVVSGSLTWVAAGGAYRVRSPIVVTNVGR